jgi:branched-chain amino acid transport system permease protein/neutral amino acid transport system permease protein
VVLQPVVNGLVFGGILVLGAIGVTLIYGIRRFPNFAHGDMMALGAYFALTFTTFFLAVIAFPPSLLWLALLIAIPISMVLMAIFGILLEWGIFRRLHGESLVRPLIASIGLAFIIQNVIRITWGTSNQRYGFPSQVARVFPGGIRLTDNEIGILISVLVLVAAVHIILKYTTLGKSMRATSDNWDLARVTGINVQRVVYATWAIGGALAASGGALLGLFAVIRPIMGFALILPIFAAVILGGIGSPYGAMAGGFLIGVGQEVSVPFLFALSEATVSVAPFVAALVVFTGIGVILGLWLADKGRRRQAKYAYVTAAAFGGVAAVVLIAASLGALNLYFPFALFFALGLQQPFAFKPAIAFAILVVVLIALPEGLAGLADRPRFKAFAKRVSEIPRTIASALGRVIPRSK